MRCPFLLSHLLFPGTRLSVPKEWESELHRAAAARWWLCPLPNTLFPSLQTLNSEPEQEPPGNNECLILPQHEQLALLISVQRVVLFFPQGLNTSKRLMMPQVTLHPEQAVAMGQVCLVQTRYRADLFQITGYRATSKLKQCMTFYFLCCIHCL